MSLLAARCKAIRRLQDTDPEKSEAEILSKLVAYTSEQVQKNMVYGSNKTLRQLCKGLMSINGLT